MKLRHGYDVGEDRSDFLFAGELPGAPDGPRWRAGLARWNAKFAADADCRRPAYVAAMRLVDQRLGPWLVQHRAQLDTIRREWRSRVAAAERLRR